jgi:hypothetical protein
MAHMIPDLAMIGTVLWLGAWNVLYGLRCRARRKRER